MDNFRIWFEITVLQLSPVDYHKGEIELVKILSLDKTPNEMIFSTVSYFPKEAKVLVLQRTNQGLKTKTFNLASRINITNTVKVSGHLTSLEADYRSVEDSYLYEYLQKNYNPNNPKNFKSKKNKIFVNAVDSKYFKITKFILTTENFEENK